DHGRVRHEEAVRRQERRIHPKRAAGRNRDMTEKIELRMKKAHESLAAAELLLKNSYVDIAASRGYYAMFYAAEALLYTRGLEFKSHKAVISNFGREFAKSGQIDAALHRHLIEAERVRHAGDYGQGPL